MDEAQNKVVSIEAFRAARKAAASREPAILPAVGARAHLSRRDIEHRERMLRFLRGDARQSQHLQGCLLL